jgi:hypothetical protein
MIGTVFAIAIFVFNNPGAHAGLFGKSGDIRVSQSYACVSLDGIPIPEGTELSSKCCTNGKLNPSPPISCRAFSGVGAAAAKGAAFSINVAQNTLETAKSMTGAVTNYDAKADSKNSATQSATDSRGDSSALLGGSGSLDSTTGTNPNLKLPNALSGSSKGTENSASGASGSSAAGGSGSSVGASGSSANHAESGAGSAAAADGARVGYVSGSGASGAAASGALGFNFGALGGSSAGAGGDKGPDELALGDGTNGQSNGLANGEEDGVRGTSDDPADYFSRIDQSANLFKVVSSRYLKKKSLYVVKSAP